MKSPTPKEIEELKWKNAPGITKAGKRGTNKMLAERDYEVRCDITGDPLMVVHGVHIWFCKSHHQPYSHCEQEKLKIQTLCVMEAIRKNDKTTPYEFGSYRFLDESKNADGEMPANFQRWLTPKEIALNFIRVLKS